LQARPDGGSGGDAGARGDAAAQRSRDQRPSGRCLLEGGTAAGGALPVEHRPLGGSGGQCGRAGRPQAGGRPDARKRHRIASQMSAGALSQAAPAKINLALHVTGRRADGYHELESLVVFADLADKLEAVPADTDSLAVSGPFAAMLGSGSSNLALRAAARSAEQTSEFH